MKVSEFTKVIRKVIREEVRAALREELSEQNNKVSDDQIIENGKSLHKSVDNFEKKSYAKNSLLNDILNETANVSKPIPQMGNKTFTSQDAVGGIRSKFAEAMNADTDFGGTPTAQEMIPDDKKHIHVPDYIQNALTKDYSSLVKTMDKKK